MEDEISVDLWNTLHTQKSKEAAVTKEIYSGDEHFLICQILALHEYTKLMNMTNMWPFYADELCFIGHAGWKLLSFIFSEFFIT